MGSVATATVCTDRTSSGTGWRLWNEQYLVEAFLSFNKEFKIIGALNFLKHRYPKELARCCPVLGDQIE